MTPYDAKRVLRQLVALCDALRESNGDAWSERAEMLDNLDAQQADGLRGDYAADVAEIADAIAEVIDSLGYPCVTCHEGGVNLVETNPAVEEPVCGQCRETARDLRLQDELDHQRHSRWGAN